jgi:hypothetical protein
MTKIIIGGASSIFNLSQIKSAFASLGWEVKFEEAPFMLDYGTVPADEPVVFRTDVHDTDVIVPLTEFWISYCIKTGKCRISSKALESSRSKKYFYDLLASNGIDSVSCFSNRTDADAALEKGMPIVVKPEGLCSGLGVEIITAENKNKLDAYISKALSINTKFMKLMHLKNEGCMFTECIEGTEYSADCFYYEGRISMVRVCKKVVLLLRDKPCAAVYQLVKPSAQIEQKLQAWTNVLFEKDNISFAQYDFIVTPDESRIVPVDFACRIGGGLRDMMMQSGTNPYADAIKGERHLPVDDKILTQLNYLSIQNGYLKSDDFKLEEGFRVVFKHKGDYVISNPSSVGSRVALVVQKRDSEEIPQTVLNSLLIDEKWIIKE